MADPERDEPTTTAPQPRRRRRLVLLVGLVGIVLWQSVFFRHSYPETTLESPYRLEASGGVLSWQPEFVYFLYYLNLYPVATISQSPLEYSVEGARRLIAERGETLVMDRYWTLRYGDLAKTYLYLPHVWLKGRPVRPRMTHANAFAFTLALVALFAAFWSAERALLGTLLVALIGSDPFQVHQVYANNNLFGWPITVTVLVLALHVPLMRDRPPRLASALAIALVSGLILGSVRQIRTEPVLVMASAAGVYLTASRLRPWLRLTLVVLLGAAFTWTSAAWASYFDAKYREAYTVVKAAGGHTYDGARHPYHFFWHAVWCGLGDFDLKYGYQWSDLSAIRYAWPVLQRRGVTVDGFAPPRPDELDSLTTGVYWDRGGLYARTPFELPEYIGVVRDKVLRDVLDDPGWYASIIARRLARLVSEATPPSLALGNGWNLSLASQPTAELRRGRGDAVSAVASPSPQPLWGWATFLVSAWLMWRRAWFHLKLLAFTLPLAATAVIVYSGGGTTYYSIVHLVALAVAGTLVWERLRARDGEARRVDEQASPTPIRSWRLPLAFGSSGLLALIALLAVARRVATPAHAPAARGDPPAAAIMRFDNQTSSDSLAWVGDALGELLAAEVERAGGRVLDPEAVAWLDADLVVWGPSSILSGPRARVVNIIADRSGVERVVAGRVYQDPGGIRACVELLGPGRPAAMAPELCEHVDPGRPLDTSAKLARAVLPALGVTLATAPGSRPGSANAIRFYTEARRSIRRQMWGKASRLLDRSLREDPGLAPARTLRARLSSRWRPLAPDVLVGLTGTASVRGAVEVLRAELATRPLSIDVRMDLGRLLIDLELFDEAAKTLHPLLTTPGAPAEAFGLLANALASLGDLPRGYQALLEARRRSWQEPLGNSLMGAHLTRWGHLELATLFLNDAENERGRGTGAPPLVLDDLLSRWSIRALQDEWPQAAQLASQMLALDDPRAKGVGGLCLAIGYLLHGRSRLSVVLAEEAALDLAQQQVDVSDALATAVEVRLERNQAADALELVRRLRATDSSPTDPGPAGRRISYWEAIVLAELRQWLQADAVRGRLAREVSDMPGPAGRRLLRQLDGELRLRRGDATGALASLSEAAELLPARGFCGDQVPTWFALGKANLAAGRADQARAWLERVARASNERLCWPIPYARSHLLLGRIGAATGKTDAAVPAYRRFLRLWGEADFASAERDEARRYLAANEKQAPSASSQAEAQTEE
jgi:tetratricopeptide (TPR) repeat protein